MMNADAVFFALSDPTRRAILTRLTQGEAAVKELAAPFEMSQPAVSRHLRVLEDAGLLTRRVDGTRRPCRIRPEGFENAESWLGRLRLAMEDNYARLDALLAGGPDSTLEES